MSVLRQHLPNLIRCLALTALLFLRPEPALACVGDCNRDNLITVDEIVLGVNIALGVTPISACERFDGDQSGDLTVDELVSAVDSALRGCATPTPTPMPTGPRITSLSLADGEIVPVLASGVDESGREIYRRLFGGGFWLIVEAATGPSNLDVGDVVFQTEPFDPTLRPDLQILVSRQLGNGNPVVCDNRGTLFEGIPAAASLSFDDSQLTTNVINEMSCRVDGGAITRSGDACTQDEGGGGFGFGFVGRGTETQFCVQIANAWEFPVGDTIVAARVLDVLGNPGEIREIVVRVAQ